MGLVVDDCTRVIDFEAGFLWLHAQAKLPEPLGLESRRMFSDVMTLLQGGPDALLQAREVAAVFEVERPRSHALSDVHLLSPIARPSKIIACGHNYRSHLAEMTDLPSTSEGSAREPEGFVKLASTIIGPYDAIVRPRHTKKLDYEVEVAVVLGRRAVDVPPSEALGYVAGYTIANDVSARDWQLKERRRGRSPLIAKNFDTFLPLGPWLVTSDEVPNPSALELRLTVNGEQRQLASAQDMIFSIEEQVAHWSKIGLGAGDILLTGTPGGVALGHESAERTWYLQPGDIVEATVDGLGTIRNQVKALHAGDSVMPAPRSQGGVHFDPTDSSALNMASVGGTRVIDSS